MKINDGLNAARPLFSIIIPVYNVKGYIEKTIESVISQTYGDYELLLVDDGATDGSGDYIDSIAKTDCRVKVFHQRNQGVSAARNLGLDNANGRWIVFVDGDDALKANALQILADCIEEQSDVDLIGYGFERVSAIVPSELVGNGYRKSVIDCSNTVCMKALDHYTVWGEAFRRDLIGNLRFENLKNGEDMLFCNALACRSMKYMEVDAKLYLYLQRESSARNNEWMERRFDDYSRMNEAILDNLINCDKAIDRAWLKRWVGSLLFYVPQIFHQSRELQNIYFSRHRQLLKNVRCLRGLPAYLKSWITVASAINSKSVYRMCAMRPMSLYAEISNR